MDDIFSLPGPKFYRLAWRLSAYQGVMAAQVASPAQERDDVPQEPPAAAPRVTPPSPGTDWVRQSQRDSAGRDIIPATKEAIRSHPQLAGIISFE